MYQNNFNSLSLNSTVSELSLIEAEVDAGLLVIDGLKILKENLELPGLILKKDNEFLGMIARNSFFDVLSKPFSLELFSKRNLEYYFSSNTNEHIIRIIGTTKIVDVAKIAVNRPQQCISEPIVIQINDKFKLLDSYYLLQAQSYLQVLVLNSLEEAYRQITVQNNIIAAKNKHIQDSINSAKIIQTSLLPNDELLCECFYEHFAIFKPKDTVSGDFYWCNKVDEAVILAVMDCTGHGVPGAFMSMLGNSLINHIVSERKIVEPSRILEMMNEGILANLRHNNNNSGHFESIDAAIVAINKKNRTITFAGAKRPLLYIVDETFGEIQGTVHSLGGRQIEHLKNFKSHEISYQNEIILYLYTDGFTDQNNFERKKFGSVRLKETLKELMTMGLDEQKYMLENMLAEHSEGTIQRDDVTLIGIKVINN